MLKPETKKTVLSETRWSQAFEFIKRMHPGRSATAICAYRKSHLRPKAAGA